MKRRHRRDERQLYYSENYIERTRQQGSKMERCGVQFFMKKKTMDKQKRCVGQQKDFRINEAKKTFTL